MSKKIIILIEYLDFADIFWKKSAVKFSECFDINKHSINLEPGKQLPYSPIYCLELVELITLKTNIKINLANNSILLFKFSTKTLIFFVQKPDGSFCLWIDYQGLNNLTTKIPYVLFLICELLKQLGKTKQFI